jgi:hypothetical protein
VNVLDYLRRGFDFDCAVHAAEVAALLVAEGRAPWIAELRGAVTETPDGMVYAPLVAAGRAWNRHFVCCCDGEAYDPLAGEPVPLAGYARRVFGHDVELHERFSAEATARLVAEGRLRQAFRPGGGEAILPVRPS